jgi:hypothetical protein
MEKSLTDFTDSELSFEIERREKCKKERREKAKLEEWERILDTKDIWLSLVPKHSRTSCSDKEAINYERGCARCALLNWEVMNGYTLEVTPEKMHCLEVE